MELLYTILLNILSTAFLHREISLYIMSRDNIAEGLDEKGIIDTIGNIKMRVLCSGLLLACYIFIVSVCIILGFDIAKASIPTMVITATYMSYVTYIINVTLMLFTKVNLSNMWMISPCSIINPFSFIKR